MGDYERYYIVARRSVIFLEILSLCVVALLIVAAVRFFVMRPFLVSGDSMTPALSSGDYLVIDEWTYLFHTPKRGDVVVFHYPVDPAISFVKRVVGLPGDTVGVTNGRVYIQQKGQHTGVLLAEPYIKPEVQKENTGTTTLGTDEYFMLGDNRNASFDSRVWGPIVRRQIIGRALLRVLPLTHVELFPGKATLPNALSATSSVLSTGK